MNYSRSYSELKLNATNFWSQDLLAEASAKSKIPILIQTQDEFISILNFKVNSIEDFFTSVKIASLSKNIFLLHLIVLSDVGVEFIQKINLNFIELFPSREIDFIWNEKRTKYKFKALPVGSISHLRLKTDNVKLMNQYPLNDLYKDLIALLLFGSSTISESTSRVLSKCELGVLIGRKNELSEFVKRRYIEVSKINSGSTANDLGNIAQTKVKNFLKVDLADLNLNFKDNGNINNIFSEETDGLKKLTTFDLVINNSSLTKFLAIEVSFQVTTNSTIERKAGQAMSRYEQMKFRGYPICYVIDGAGNFQRENAIARICNYSNCTIAFSNPEFKVLGQFVRSYFEN